jgi:hypothetical protein
MQDQFNPESWKAGIALRKGKTFKDALAWATVKFISLHAFKTDNSPEWPNQHFGEIFGVCRISRGVYRVCRTLHGHNIIMANGVFLPAHAARLSDMCEVVFGPYRLEPARAKWNFSKEWAKLDLEREPLLAKSLRELENILVFKQVLPPLEYMPALRALVEVRGAARPEVTRPKRVDVLESKVSAFDNKLKGLETAFELRLDEITECLEGIRRDVEAARVQIKETVNERIHGIEQRAEELAQQIIALS